MGSPNAPVSPPRHPVVVPNATRWEMLTAMACGVGILGFVIYGVATMGSTQKKATKNLVVGKVKAKRFTPGAEDQISFSRKQGMKSRHIAGEYVFDVYVASENRTFEVPVDPSTYQVVRIGETFQFLRPPSEQAR